MYMPISVMIACAVAQLIPGDLIEVVQGRQYRRALPEPGARVGGSVGFWSPGDTDRAACSSIRAVGRSV